nr:helix-turn-helix transcriptional regulator [Micromonospora sp. DSM 115978]
MESEDDWLTAAEIADRTGRSRQNVSQLVRGDRGPGGFPAPVVRRGARSPLWSWDEVRRWFAEYAPEDAAAVSSEAVSSDFLAAVNDRLDLRERRR